MIPPCKGGQPAANHVLIMRPFCLLGKMGSGGSSTAMRFKNAGLPGMAKIFLIIQKWNENRKN